MPWLACCGRDRCRAAAVPPIVGAAGGAVVADVARAGAGRGSGVVVAVVLADGVVVVG